MTLPPLQLRGSVPLEISTRGQDTLRWIAIVLMLIDHASKTLVHDEGHIGHLIGRAAFPLFALLIAYHLERHGTPLTRYLLPFALFGVMAQIPYGGLFGGPNIMLTLALGAIACAPPRVKFGSLPHVGLIALALAAASVFDANYGPFGVLLVVAARVVIRQPGLATWTAFGVCVLVANASPLGATALLSIPITFAAMRLPGQRWRVPRFLPYWVYPLHLWLIVGIIALRH